ncbi:hypothetical protein BDZ90DRAFT_217348 [Jaminaea rosea]|uniref:Calcineurin-like phosphoesterase domain-containing protein n=1 Tax=Jaminaea rosea TaxID=1569628 RepID=A0A316UVD8_9BASI|nr:hypothetical protein BDZ90DRAFT_217348 [Jaminaea rosea]PWN29270.1 hypothetical protein BDZ90DRAFT_217348 [Jaminaea rosea]
MGRLLLALAAATLALSTHLTASLTAHLEDSSSSSSSSSSSQPASPLTGRFLHLTDLHPDVHYQAGSSISKGCHAGKPKKHDRAGHWGSPVSGCDSPRRLVEASIEWVKRAWTPPEGDGRHAAFDFIIWTGDSARHDLDSLFPRTREEIYASNKWCLDLISAAFPGVPIVPNLGNNDVFPHNIMWGGPSELIGQYAEMWDEWVPEWERHTFQLGGYFTVEVLQGRLAVVSLNTLYWYDSNKVVDGCKGIKRERRKLHKGRGRSSSSASASSAHLDPGTRQLLWLEAQLSQLRKRGLAVHIIGHVPPTAGNYFPRCYAAYTDIVLDYQDTVVGQHFGHMNVDAFWVQEDVEAERRAKKDPDVDETIRATTLTDDLRKDYAVLPRRAKEVNESYYHYFFTAPGIVPTFVPSVRVWTYNVTGNVGRGMGSEGEQGETEDHAEEEDDEDPDDSPDHHPAYSSAQLVLSSPPPSPDSSSPHLGASHSSRLHSLRRKHRRPKHGRRHRRNRHPYPRHTSRHSPSRTNTGMSLLGYSQWKLDLDWANDEWERQRGERGVHSEKEKREGRLDYRLEYATYTPETLWGSLLPHVDAELNASRSKPSKELHEPVPRRLLEREIALRSSDPGSSYSSSPLARLPPLKWLTEYGLESISVSSMLGLARRLVKEDGLWKRYEGRVYGESGWRG